MPKGFRGFQKGNKTKGQFKLGHKGYITHSWNKGKNLSDIHKEHIRISLQKFYDLHPERKRPPQEKKPKYVFPKGHKINLGKIRKKKGTYKTCPVCKKEFYITKCLSRLIYCSRLCMSISTDYRKNISTRMKNRIIPESLKKQISLKLREITPRGEHSRLWQGGKSYEPYPIKWTRLLKMSIRERDNFTCQICGKKPSLHVHHIDYNKLNCDTKNLITLCIRCHVKTNQNRPFWLKFFGVSFIEADPVRFHTEIPSESDFVRAIKELS